MQALLGFNRKRLWFRDRDNPNHVGEHPCLLPHKQTSLHLAHKATKAYPREHLLGEMESFSYGFSDTVLTALLYCLQKLLLKALQISAFLN